MGKQLASDKSFGFIPDDAEVEDPKKLAAKKQQQTDFGFIPDEPKKKDGSVESSTSSLDLSPAANYRQGITDYNQKAEELRKIQNDLVGYKKLIDDHNVMQQDEKQLEIFKANTAKYNQLVGENNKRIKELDRLRVLLDQGKKVYDADNFERQQKLFDDLNLEKQDRQNLINQIYKQIHPERAKEVDDGTFIPAYLDIDTEDLAKNLTGKSTAELERRKKLEANRPISDRIFGTFSRSVEKTLAFELPAATAGTITNLLSSAKIKDSDLEKSAWRPGVGNQIKKAIDLIPGAQKAIN
ncbi:MAG TPA: hypothetical protein VGD31_14080, partial [Sphingobacteriaceae bacterium]